MKKFLFPLLAAGLFLSQIHASQAVVVTFANVNLTSNSTFTLTPVGTGLTPNGGTGVYTSSTLTGTDTSTATFFFSNTSGSVPTLQATPFGAANPINATFTLTAATNQNGDATGLTGATQEFSSQTFSIRARGPQVINGINIANNANLLTETILTGSAVNNGTPPGANAFQAGLLSGTLNTTNPSFSGGDVITGPGSLRSLVTFTSDFVNFAGSDTKGFSFGFASAQPFYQLNSDSVGNLYIRNFTAAGVGNFNAQFAVPEPGSVALMVGMGVSGSAFLLRRRRRK